MNLLRFHSGKPPKGFKPCFEYSLFNLNAHRKLQSSSGWIEFHAVEDSMKKISASVFFCVKGAKAVSPCKAPFGSFDYSENLNQQQLAQFIAYVDMELSKMGIQEVHITNAPECYYSDSEKLAAALKREGYSVEKELLSAAILIDEHSLQSKMHKSKQRQNLKSSKAGFSFKILKSNKLKVLYQFIDSCRKAKNQLLSMSYDELKTTVSKLPHAFVLTTVFNEKKLIAASICVQPRSNILYSFYPAHDADYNSYSPMTFLLSHLYDWCRTNKIKLLDLGTSTSDGKLNASLLEFKVRVGGTLNSKFSFYKKLTT